jgi:hypothetical protein
MVAQIPFLRAICPIVRRSVLLSGVIERSKDTIISTIPSITLPMFKDKSRRTRHLTSFFGMIGMVLPEGEITMSGRGPGPPSRIDCHLYTNARKSVG